MSLLSLTWDVTRTFVLGDLRVNIERDRGLEEMTAARILVGSRIIVQSHFSHRKNWWRNWSSTALARRKGTCDDVRLGSWKREGIQSRRMKWVAFVFKIKMFYGFDPTDHTFFWNGSLCWLRLGQAEHALYDANVCRELKPDWSKRCCFREGVALCFLQRFVEAANAFLRRSKAKRSVMSSEKL